MGFPSPRRSGRCFVVLIEALEERALLSAAFDLTGLTALRNDPAFTNITGQGVGIAVLDTGVYAQNPDLSSNVVAFYNAVEDPVSTTDVSVSNAFDDDGHGSHVSGIAASSNPAIGVAYGAKLVDIRVIADSGESQLGGDPVLRGLQWVAANYQTYNIKVVNMSLGESGVNDNTVTTADAQDSEAVEIKALQKLGITVVSASGNSYANDPVPGASFPAVVSTISVANTWATAGQASDFNVPYGGDGDQYYAIDYSATPDTLASTSQRSTLDNQIAAPGEDIYSTWNGTQDSSNGSDLLHNTISGTSMAAPFVSGVVALMQQAAKYFGGHYISDPAEILQIIQQTADTVVDSNNPNNARYNSSSGATSNLPETGLSFKRVDVLKAIEEVEKVVTGGSITVGPAPGPDTDNTSSTATPVNNIDGTTLFTFDGSIGTDGLVQVGATDVDLYQLDVVSPGNLTITLSQPATGTAFAATLTLFDSTGAVITHVSGTASAYPTLSTPADSPLAVGTYYLGISGIGNTNYKIDGTGATAATSQGDYTVQIELQNPDPNGTAQGAVPIDLTQTNEILTDQSTGVQFTDVLEQGELGSDPPPIGSTTRIVVSSDVDMFQMVAPDTGKLSITTDTSNYFDGADTYLKVYDQNLTLLGANDNANAFTTDSAVTINVTAGQTYYVAVTVPANSGFDPKNPYNSRTADATPNNAAYDLHLSFDNGDVNGTALSAVAGTIGTTVNGAIGSDNGVPLLGANGGNKDVDWLSYTAASAGLFDVSAASGNSAGFTPVVSLWEFTQGTSNIVKVADTSALATPELIAPVSANETFFVAITGLGNNDFNWFAVASGSGGQTGTYSLSTTLRPSSTLTALSDNSIQNATPQAISEGQVLNGNLGMDGNVVIGPTDVDLYKFVASASETADIHTITNQEGDADTVLRVFDASGNQLASNDNLNSSTTASGVTIPVQQGQTYYIGISGAGPNSLAYDPLTGAGAGSGSTGNYSLSVSVSMPGFTVSAPASVIALNGAQIVFTVTLDKALSASSTVDYATADGTAIAGTDYTAASGTLTFAAGVTSQTLSVAVTPNAAVQGNRTFTLTLSNPTGAQIVGATATGTINDVPVTTVAFSAGKPGAYTDGAGNKVILALAGPGAGSAYFITGMNDPVEVMLDNTTAASIFTVHGAGATLTDVTVNGSLFALSAKTAAFNGSLTITGSLSKLSLASVTGGTTGGTISIGAAGAPTIVDLGNVSNESLSTAGAISLLNIGDWLNSNSNGSALISAASIGPIHSKGDFAASITAGAVGSVDIAGAISGGNWAIAGGGENLSVTGDASSGWDATFGGSLGNVRFAGDDGSLTALSIQKLSVTGDLSNALVRVTGTTGTVLGGLKVGQAVSNSQIRSAGSIGHVSVGAFLDSTLFAGVNDSVTALPTAATDLTADDSILSFSVAGKIPAGSFSDSNIAASSIGKVKLADVNSNNNGTPFGIAAVRLGAFKNGHILHWTSKQPAGLLVADGDLVERLLS